MPHPASGSVPTLASPMHFSRTPVRYELPPPMLGEHTAQLLEELCGVSSTEFAKLKGGGAV